MIDVLTIGDLLVAMSLAILLAFVASIMLGALVGAIWVRLIRRRWR
jgi:hypothetical protein